MNKTNPGVALVTGASSGIGYPVNKGVGTPKNDRPELIEEIHVSR